MIAVHECAGAIIDGFAANQHIVGVHHPVNEPEADPLRDQVRLSVGHVLQHFGRAVRVREMARLRMIEQRLKRIGVLKEAEKLKGPDTDMAAGDAGQHCAGQGGFAIDCVACCHRRQSTRGRNAQGVHSLGHQVFADDRPQPSAPIARAAIRGAARSFELDIETTARGDDLAQQQGAPVT